MNHDEPLRLLILGAHPDDAEYHAGGLSCLYRQRGHAVRMVSMTDGSAGHHAMKPDELAEVRRQEAAESAALIGAEYEIWDFPDGQLQTTLTLRERVIREIRLFRPDLVLTHRTNDYHPDHRAAGQAVQDASFLVRVPLVVPEVPPLPKDPVVAFMADLFTKPSPLRADVVLDIAEQLDTVVAMLACHRSQVFEWLPYLDGVLEQVEDEAERERLAWLRQVMEAHPQMHLVVVSGQVTVEAPPAWRAAHPLVYAEALLMVCQHAAQAVRRHLLPHLSGR